MAKVLLPLLLIVVACVVEGSAAAGHEPQVQGQEGQDFGRQVRNHLHTSPGQTFEPSAYAQWAAFHISYNSYTQGGDTIVIRNSGLPWGKWYAYPNKDDEVKSPDGTTIHSGDISIISACGRDFSPSGTQGSFELWKGDLKKIATINFDCPWNWFSSNSMALTKSSQGFLFDYNVAPQSGPIGDIYITVFEM